MKTVACLFLLTLTVLVALLSRRAMLDGDDGAELLVGAAMLFGSLTIVSMVATAATALSEPAIEIIDDRVEIGAPPPSSDPAFYTSATVALCGSLWFLIGIATDIALFSVIGVVITLPYLVMSTVILFRGNRFTALVAVSTQTIRISQPGRVREFPWAAISQVRGRQTANLGGGSRPELEFRCYAAQVITHAGPPEALYTNDATIPRTYQINPLGMYIAPNALLATLEFMVTHPEQRSTLSLDQITAMLVSR